MSVLEYKVAVAGHICLDVIPMITDGQIGKGEWMTPGRLVSVGPATIATGGAVANTGIALHRLGAKVQLMGKVGDDLYGKAVLDICSQHGDHLVDGMIVAKEEHSSYSIVISPPDSDRIFLHYSGTNDTFSSDDLDWDQLAGVNLFHFGYPPLMRNMYADKGKMLSAMFKKVKAAGIMTSLDMAMPDEKSDAGQVDWRIILQETLPHIDLFLPSLEEILFMLRPDKFKELESKHGSSSMLAFIDGNLLNSLADELLEMGVKVIVLKLGEHGLYMRTTSSETCLQQLDFFSGNKYIPWVDCELLMPSFKVQVQGTTGAGDCTIAGFIVGLLRHLTPERTLQCAVGVGGYNVEKSDAISGIVSWEELEKRIKKGWRHQDVTLHLDGWRPANSNNVWIGSNNQIKNR